MGIVKLKFYTALSSHGDFHMRKTLEVFIRKVLATLENLSHLFVDPALALSLGVDVKNYGTYRRKMNYEPYKTKTRESLGKLYDGIKYGYKRVTNELKTIGKYVVKILKVMVFLHQEGF